MHFRTPLYFKINLLPYIFLSQQLCLRLLSQTMTIYIPQQDIVSYREEWQCVTTRKILKCAHETIDFLGFWALKVPSLTLKHPSKMHSTCVPSHACDWLGYVCQLVSHKPRLHLGILGSPSRSPGGPLAHLRTPFCCARAACVCAPRSQACCVNCLLVEGSGYLHVSGASCVGRQTCHSCKLREWR